MLGNPIPIPNWQLYLPRGRGMSSCCMWAETFDTPHGWRSSSAFPNLHVSRSSASINRFVQLCNSLWQGLKDALAGCYHYHARRGHIPQRVEPKEQLPLPQSMPHSLPQSLPLCVIRRSALDSSGCLSPRWSVQPSPLMKSTARVCTVCYLRSHSSCPRILSLPLPLDYGHVQRCPPTRNSTVWWQLRATNWPNTMPLRGHSACGTYLTSSRLVLFLASAVFHCHALHAARVLPPMLSNIRCHWQQVCAPQEHPLESNSWLTWTTEEEEGLTSWYREVSSIDNLMF